MHISPLPRHKYKLNLWETPKWNRSMSKRFVDTPTRKTTFKARLYLQKIDQITYYQGDEGAVIACLPHNLVVVCFTYERLDKCGKERGGDKERTVRGRDGGGAVQLRKLGRNCAGTRSPLQRAKQYVTSSVFIIWYETSFKHQPPRDRSTLVFFTDSTCALVIV